MTEPAAIFDSRIQDPQHSGAGRCPCALLLSGGDLSGTDLRLRSSVSNGG
jgi:hypothetical protein